MMRLTPEIAEQIVQYIRAGGYGWVAAEAAGVPRATFEDWLRRGSVSRRSRYHQFFRDVMQATAQARLKAEVEVHSQHPRDWLRYGPGREQPGQPGWTAAVKPGQGNHASLFDSPDWLALLPALEGALAPFPDARAKVVAVLRSLK